MKKNLLLTVILGSMFLLTCEKTNAQTHKFVTRTGSGSKDGSSWSNAIDSLGFQPAVVAASAQTEFWVAAGIYKPTYGLVETITFNIPDSVKLFGGFNGTETLLSQRDYKNNVTILDGSLGNPSDTDNVNRIVTFNHVTEQAVLDGFTLQNAYNNNPAGYPDARGGAIYIDGSATGSSKPVIANCILQNNQSTSGAGAYSNASDGGDIGEHFINCVFRHNVSYITHGGAYRAVNLNGGIIESTFDNCLFENDTVSQSVYPQSLFGGAMFFGTAYSSLGGIRTRINGCKFNGNSAFVGAAIMIQDDSNTSDSITISNCEFYGNGGSSSPGFSNVHFGGNGTGVFIISHCIFKGNIVTDLSSSFNGGAIFINGGGGTINTTIDNCLLSGNNSTVGGGVGVFGGSLLTTVNITNSTITGSSATLSGGAISIISENNGDKVNLNIHNSILWGNSSSIDFDTVGFVGTYHINADNSIIEGGYAGTNILNTDPKFVLPLAYTSAPDTSGNFQLQSGSPAINSGNNSFVTSLSDLLGNIRIHNGTVDMGCYEFGSVPMNVTQLPFAENNFLIYPNPFSNEFKINSEKSGEVILYDITGKEILHQNIFAGETTINAEKVSPGFYLLHFTDGKRTENFKVVKL